MNIETSCEKCVFATWHKDYLHGMPPFQNIQDGCYFNRLNKFKSASINVKLPEIIRWIDKYGSNPDYYLPYATIGANCNRCFQTDNSLSTEEYAKLAIEKSRLTFDLIVSPRHTGELHNYVKLFKQLNPKPEKLFILDRSALGQNKEFVQVLMGESFKWQIISGIVATYDDLIDKTESEYFWIYDLLEVPPYDILQTVDNIWNEQMIQFFCIYGKYGILANKYSYRMFVNKCDKIVDDFKNIDEKFELKTGKKTYDWKELL